MVGRNGEKKGGKEHKTTVNFFPCNVPTVERMKGKGHA